MCSGIQTPCCGKLGNLGVSFEIMGLRDSRDPSFELVEDSVKAEENAADPIIST